MPTKQHCAGRCIESLLRRTGINEQGEHVDLIVSLLDNSLSITRGPNYCPQLSSIHTSWEEPNNNAYGTELQLVEEQQQEQEELLQEWFEEQQQKPKQ